MPRRNNPRRSRASRSGSSRRSNEPRPLSGAGWPRTESGPDGDWLVRDIPGAQSVKTYRCPGCDHEIRPGVPHVVAWPAEGLGAAEERRHWHTGCWRGRHTRRPTRRWW
ncbi:MAG TPA: hypothetical protein VIL00_09340 [Pseudonocardiaceae bacterium]